MNFEKLPTDVLMDLFQELGQNKLMIECELERRGAFDNFYESAKNYELHKLEKFKNETLP